MAFELAIVLPTLNERENVAFLVDRLARVLTGIRYEVIFVDDDSADSTAAVVRRLAQDHENVRVLHRIGRRGLSSACIEGILASCAPVVAVMDADMQHDERVLCEMLRRLREDELDLVVASRNIAGGGMPEFAKRRVWLSNLGKRLSRICSAHQLSDPMSGFFMIRFQAFERIAHRLSGVGFKILLDIVSSARPDLRIGEVPYEFRNREYGESKLDCMVGLEYIQLLFDKRLGSVVNGRFVLYCMVGAMGVVAQLGMLRMLMYLAGAGFAQAQAVATAVVMILNYVLNNAVTYRDRRLRGAAFWRGLLTYCMACGLGLVVNVAVSNECFYHGVPWMLAAVSGLLFSAMWNFAVTSITTWRQERRSNVLRARLIAENAASLDFPAKDYLNAASGGS
jgi:dolichol-phosphate mannosyltransferase